MSGIVSSLWLVPVVPLLAAGVLAVTPRGQRRLGSSLAIVSMSVSLVISLVAFFATLGDAGHGEVSHHVYTFSWLQMGTTPLRLGWVLDPLTAIMLVMVSLVGLLIFIYSVGYMAHDENFTRFFCFLSLFAAAMLGLVIANHLLLLFVCWELVGLASYLLIGFWYHKPSAAAAAKKAFITTRIGDLGLFLGMLFLYSKSNTLLFYDGGNGCLEAGVLNQLATQTTIFGLTVSTAIGLLIFCGAMGKSGQVPLHVWLPDAMEGPTPVSALIHAATMVAAGVFLVARVYPLMAALPPGATGTPPALAVVTWVGTLTAVFAACIAVGQDDIKRILAYSTISQLGYMMMGLGVGGVAVGMFHLITHAFFKALLFMGAGSVIHGCHEEQNIRRMGGLKDFMPLTFLTYAVGMMALCGVPLFFAGFWSKDEILHNALAWPVSRWPFYLGVAGAFLTAFYMTRQLAYVFFGKYRGGAEARPYIPRLPAEQSVRARQEAVEAGQKPDPVSIGSHDSAALKTEEGHLLTPHESPRIMTTPLVILAIFSVLLGFLGTPAWPWFQGYLTGEAVRMDLGALFHWGVMAVMLFSALIVFFGIGLAWKLYGLVSVQTPEQPDALERLQPAVFALLRHQFYVDALYDRSVIRANDRVAKACVWMDRMVWGGIIQLVSLLVLVLSWVDRFFDEFVVNLGFDRSCRGLREGGGILSLWQNGQVQRYLRGIGLGLALLALIFLWGCRA